MLKQSSLGVNVGSTLAWPGVLSQCFIAAYYFSPPSHIRPIPLIVIFGLAIALGMIRRSRRKAR